MARPPPTGPIAPYCLRYYPADCAVSGLNNGNVGTDQGSAVSIQSVPVVKFREAAFTACGRYSLIAIRYLVLSLEHSGSNNFCQSRITLPAVSGKDEDGE